MDPRPSLEALTALRQHWIWLDGWVDAPRAGEAARLVEFKRTFQLNSLKVVRISADTRYKLIVNGKRVAVGPARGCEQRWFYDTVNIGPFLASGENTILVRVLRYFPSVNAGIPFGRTTRPGFTLVGEGISSGPDWLAREGGVVCPVDEGTLLQRNTSVGGWTQAVSRPDRIGFGILPNWRLEPRMIPMPEESTAPFQAIRHANGNERMWTEFFEGKPIDLAPNSHHPVEVEYAGYNTAFLSLLGKGTADMSITYSECYAPPHGKGDRTSRQGQSLFGPSDKIHFTGVYEPFWWRAFRYLLIEIDVGESLHLESLTATQTNYPMNITASWESSEEAEIFWEISIRTMRNCMFDGYSDCPFYEQLQYCEDARSAMLFHYILSGDDRLARQAIIAFADSQLSDGMVCGRAPAHGTQVITGFSLFWVLQVCDHHLHFGDDGFARRFLPQIHAVLAYFQRRMDGIVRGLPREYWSFIDWVQTWQPEGDFVDGGVPLAGRKTGTWTYFSMLFVYTVKHVSRMLGDLGEPLIHADTSAINALFDGLYPDSDEGGYSQHAQVWAVLSGCTEPLRGRQILVDSFERNLPHASYPMTHYLFRALATTDLYHVHFDAMWEPWRRMVSQHLTTWAEDDVNQRSDCHEWSSLPIYEYGYGVLGLDPLAPAWDKLRFTPRFLLVQRVKAKVNLGPTLAKVEWEETHARFNISLSLEHPLHVITKLPGKPDVDHGRVTEVTLQFNL